ncbi:MAG: type II secretion system GspH family protein [Kiritimatiellaeota bacterium]|nr:type II secretion system GspH family protein [Kiritimatiellota bacterium]
MTQNTKIHRFRIRQDGFTLLEMLVIIGIIGILMAVLLPSYGYIQEAARQSRAQTLVRDAATALTAYVQRERAWPTEILDSGGYLDHKVCKILHEAGLFDSTAYNGDNLNLDSLDRFGLLDPWGQAFVKRNPKLQDVNKELGDPPRPLKNHLLQFRIDRNFDGKVNADDGWGPIPYGQIVRESAIVWSCGPGGLQTSSAKKYLSGLRLSWALER